MGLRVNLIWNIALFCNCHLDDKLHQLKSSDLQTTFSFCLYCTAFAFEVIEMIQVWLHLKHILTLMSLLSKSRYPRMCNYIDIQYKIACIIFGCVTI